MAVVMFRPQGKFNNIYSAFLEMNINKICAIISCESLIYTSQDYLFKKVL